MMVTIVAENVVHRFAKMSIGLQDSLVKILLLLLDGLTGHLINVESVNTGRLTKCRGVKLFKRENL